VFITGEGAATGITLPAPQPAENWLTKQARMLKPGSLACRQKVFAASEQTLMNNTLSYRVFSRLESLDR